MKNYFRCSEGGVAMKKMQLFFQKNIYINFESQKKCALIKFIILSMPSLLPSFLSLIIFILFLSLMPLFLLCYNQAPAFAETFYFYDSNSKILVSGGYTFLKNSGGRIIHPQIINGRCWFSETITMEPPYIQFTFLSDNYSIDQSLTPVESLKIIKGTQSALPHGTYKIYLKIRKVENVSYFTDKNKNTFNTGRSVNSYSNVKTTSDYSSSAPAVNYNFGYNPALSVQTNSKILPRTSNNIQTYNQYNPLQNPPGKTSAERIIQNQINKQPVSLNQNYVQPFLQSTTSTSSSSTTRGGVSGYLTSGGGVPFGGGNVIVSVTNSKNQYIKSEIINTESGGGTYPYTINGIPPILPGSNDYYKINVISNNGFQTVTEPRSTGNIKIYSNGQTVQAQPIVMQARTGRLNITLYHGRPAAGETEELLSELARNAVINISTAGTCARFTGESPARFYRYSIDSAPAGSRKLLIMFPGRDVSGGNEPAVYITPDSTTTVLYTLKNGN